MGWGHNTVFAIGLALTIATPVYLMQSDIADRSAAVLTAAGLDPGVVSVDGRDVVVDATTLSTDRLDEVIALLGPLNGVRVVTVLGGTSPVESPVTTISAEPAPPTSTVVPGTTTPAPTTAPPATTIPVPEPWLVVTMVEDRLSIVGTVPDEATVRRAEIVADRVFGTGAHVKLSVSAGAPTSFLPELIATLPLATAAEIHVMPGRIELAGTVRDTDQLHRVVAGIRRATLGTTPVVVDLRLSGKLAPSFEATIDSGSVVLTGRFPDQATIDALVTAAESAYPNVDNRIVADPAVDRPLIVFRLPLLFADFSDARRWRLRTDGVAVAADISSNGGFGFDRSDVGPEARAVLEGTARLMLSDLSLSALIEGHTDSIGAIEYNLALSERRAGAGADLLADLGVARDRIETMAQGETDPAADNATAEGRRQNRRIVIRLST